MIYVRFSTALGAASWLATALSGPSLAVAQQEFLCADPRGFCSALIRPICLARIHDGALEDEADPECGGALLAYRACLGDAVECPEVVDQATPSIQADARAPCAEGECAGSPPTPIVREAPEGREALPDERPDDRLGQPG